MYRQETPRRQTMKGIKQYAAESIEMKVARMISNKEPIRDKAPLIYTEMKDGVQPDYDIRTDKYEYLVEGKSALAKSKRAKRDNIGEASKDLDKQNKDIQDKGPEKTQATES